MQNRVCMICRRDTFKKHILQQIKKLCAGVTPSSREINFLWGHHERCRYGLPCNKIDSYNRECNLLGKKLEPYIITIATEGPVEKYSQLLRLLQGNYPSVYNLVKNLNKSF